MCQLSRPVNVVHFDVIDLIKYELRANTEGQVSHANNVTYGASTSTTGPTGQVPLNVDPTWHCITLV